MIRASPITFFESIITTNTTGISIVITTTVIDLNTKRDEIGVIIEDREPISDGVVVSCPSGSSVSSDGDVVGVGVGVGVVAVVAVVEGVVVVGVVGVVVVVVVALYLDDDRYDRPTDSSMSS